MGNKLKSAICPFDRWIIEQHLDRCKEWDLCKKISRNVQN